MLDDGPHRPGGLARGEIGVEVGQHEPVEQPEPAKPLAGLHDVLLGEAHPVTREGHQATVPLVRWWRGARAQGPQLREMIEQVVGVPP